MGRMATAGALPAGMLTVARHLLPNCQHRGVVVTAISSRSSSSLHWPWGMTCWSSLCWAAGCFHCISRLCCRHKLLRLMPRPGAKRWQLLRLLRLISCVKCRGDMWLPTLPHILLGGV